ncbi:class A beta-lactamase-related serine hydrolase [Aquimarina sp. BL5]|uniref:serine hydrolase domain-containing protein n=1 Tax=Aquimarina sp. BL5 TaxID=1714860 RepID=UPI000E48BA6E|nr:serine hydrolase domain-containing protein [Aquimarina sp. BL5]AXT52608.1 class A beta-lactamase-related serine hydrolase [Aquimarina sp. BL5]RKN11672.1 class A beta-lactamase-related serine hydrolase [Aquimarina sp. BL5]
MKHYCKYATTLILLLLFMSCNSDDAVTGAEETAFTGEIKSIIEDNTREFPDNTELSIAIIDNEKTEYIGVIKKGNTLEVIDNKDRIFEIGSITKVFTSILLSDLVNKQQATLDETLQEQFDFTLKEGSDITLSQLANHTSGLEREPSNFESADYNFEDPFANYTNELLHNYLKDEVVLNNSSGSQYEYSNLGMGLLGHIISKKTGKTYENLLQEIILEPLQMNNSTSVVATVNPTQIVTGLDENGNEIPNWNFSNVIVGAGGIVSSVTDLEKFTHKNFLNDPVYNLPQASTYPIHEDINIGLGWHIFEDEDITALFHGGGTAGYVSFLSVEKRNKRAVIVLSNVSAFHPNSGQIEDLGIDMLYHISEVEN